MRGSASVVARLGVIRGLVVQLVSWLALGSPFASSGQALASAAWLLGRMSTHLPASQPVLTGKVKLPVSVMPLWISITSP